MKQGVGIGNDYSLANGLVSCEGVSSAPYIAWVKAMNNFAVSYAKPIGVRIVMLFPESVEEPDIKYYMSEFNALAEAWDMQILGGHTEIGRAYKEASFVITVHGTKSSEDTYIQDTKKIAVGDSIIMLGYTGLMGTDIIARRKTDELSKRFANSYIKGAYFKQEDYSIKDKVKTLIDTFGSNILYMHDVSHGGVYGALWQLGVKIKHGINVNHACIPIKQETVEICEFFDINPYMLDGSGAVIAVIKTDSDIEKNLNKLARNEIPASVIGRVTEDNNRVVILGDKDNPEQRYLSPIKSDEIYKVLNKLS